ncbi:MAG: N-formylglutamate amidohydrolase [Sphingomonadaceae bacterium]|nr:N-formylglutamate amidohydrolase [Sphingomonadaceae bacterium]
MSSHEIIGISRIGGILLIGDHASNHVPMDIDLGIDPTLLTQHIAWDLGVAGVARRLVTGGHVDAAILGAVSRLVCDLNRDADAPGTVPVASDGHAIPGNALDHAARQARIQRFHTPYHDAISAEIDTTLPIMLLSLHSFTPKLAEGSSARPWDVGVLYNADDRLARHAIPLLGEAGLTVGDQLPYSGKLLNYTMNRHAEARGIAYLGIEMRQDHVMDTAGQMRFADIIGRILTSCRNMLALSV